MADWRNRITGHGEEQPDQLLANPKNWRVHPKAQQDALAGVLGDIGWVQSVVVNKRTGFVLDGHLRVAMAISHGDRAIPVTYVDLDEAEEAEVLATLDPLAALAVADKQQLDALLREVESGDAGLRKLLDELARANGIGEMKEPAADPGPQIEHLEDLREKWETAQGDVWSIGNHRLVCGDCSDKRVWDVLMGEDKAHLLFTSPPYWVGKDYETQRTETEIDQFIAVCVNAWTEYVSKDCGRMVVDTGTAAIHRIQKSRKVEVLPLLEKWASEMRLRGWLLRHIRIWAKGGDLPASVSPKTDVVDQHWEHIATFQHEQAEWEHILTFWAPQGDQRGQEKIGTAWAQQGVWADVQGERSANGLHVAAFPLELPKRHIMLYSKEGEIVAEPFCGSGTTLAACEMLGRSGKGIEIDPCYVAATLERLSLMGLDPVKL
jgi:DNA modification methylase